ncbi:ATP-binding protein [Streptomyces somaliensis]|uniref:ATP-binding protein n=2 Tax=Streptomyces somaliensis TaxID=78355 RepID=UPI0020CFC220|nr:ATP-binding protein [Streptomyces somaliensis]MCP9943783.1 ATP-binding protein [Streptomyces somaliensis]
MVAGRDRDTSGVMRLCRRIGAGDLAAVAAIRGALRELWGRRVAEDPACTAELLASELVTNALVHTEYGAVVTATLAGDVLRVEVRDFAPEPPDPHLPVTDDGTHGRGLLLVQALADEWGVRVQGAGKAVWFELLGVKPAG